MSALLSWSLALAGLVLTAATAAAEAALAGSPAPQGGHGSDRDGAADTEDVWTALVVMAVIAPGVFAVGATGLVAGAYAAWSVPGAVAAALAAVAALVVAQACGLAWGHAQAPTAGRVLRPIAVLMSRALLPVRFVIRRAYRLAGAPLPAEGAPLSGEALRALVQGEEESGPIEEDEMEMIAGIMELGDTRVREVMVPRIDMVAIPIDATLDDALGAIIGAGHSRIPVYNGTVDDIAGLLYAKDLLKPFRERDFTPDLRRLLREPYFVPETKPVDVLLGELQTRKVHMAIIVDEYGGTAGLVTIEDLLEEIVGEIQDEYDREEPRIESVTDDEVVCLAGVSVDDINDLLSIHLPTELADTVAGVVFAALGRVPVVGERAVVADAELEVLALDGRRIHRVRVIRRRPEEAVAAPAGGLSVGSSDDRPVSAEGTVGQA